MNISLINNTTHAKEILIFSKNTRHLTNMANFNDVLELSDKKKDEEINYVFSTIGSALEFVDYTFLLQDVSRAFTHQLVRTRVGVSYAQQSLRVAPQENFTYFIPDELEKDQYMLAIFDSTMSGIQEGYNLMTNRGVATQDARGVLPTNICTNILMKINLRALSLLMETRLCVRAQGEFQQAALFMRDLVYGIHHWIPNNVLVPHCISKERCAYPRFDKCVLKNKYEHLNPIDTVEAEKVKIDWNKLMEAKYSPAPEQSII